ncbi:MAG: PAS domain S-box protein [Alphaproteobacteria bacterium]|nr:PAS domain S-box protein [Alphaproteobacteria bacterium]
MRVLQPNSVITYKVTRPIIIAPPVYDQDGNPIKSFGVARDVTDLKATEGKARDNEERLQDITECMSDFIWETDQDGVLTYFDTGSGELTIDVEIGVTKDENIDTSEGEGDRSFMNRAMARQESFRNLTFALRNKKNEVRWVRVSANPRFDQDDLFIGFRGAGTDITEQRRERIVENEKYKSDALDRLAGGMAHEINNLLQPVVVYSSMGESEVPQLERTQGYFRKIFTASQQAISIVQDILTFAREQRVKPEPVCLATAISEGLDIIRPTLPTALRLSELGADVSLNVAANVGGLHQVLFNLIGNAVDAVGPEGIVSIDAGSVVLYPRDAELWSILPGRYGYFSVTDDGIGMDEQNLSKVFDPFFTTKPHGTGTGLGLSVVAGLVREWGGAVDVQSKPGETVFTVYMPLVHTERQAAE